MQLSLEVIAERVRQEIEQKRLQGFELNGVGAEWETARTDYTQLLQLHRQLQQLPMRPDWRYIEPSDLADIRKEKGGEITLPPFYLAEQEIQEKIYGAWLGRIAGCILGKPLEIGLSQDQIRVYLEGANAYPLRDFVPSQSQSNITLRRDCVPSMQGYIQYAQEDDDLNYMCLAIKLLEKQGSKFTSLEVGLNWLESIPFMWTWGPEHVVYLNLASAVGEHSPKHIDLESVTTYLNPGVEWIGAQIRTDVYGYVCPGDPQLAAEFAWRDAYLTHRKTGLYGAMWISAMNAAAFTLLDAESVIRAGLSQIPAKSRFHEAILKVIDWYHIDNNWEQTGRRIREAFDQYGFAGTINNACCVAAALLYGWGDGKASPADRFEQTITIAVQLGYDTDCNGASAGSIVGLMLGSGLMPEKWTTPFNDALKTCVVGFGQVSIREMARRTYELSRIIRACR